MEVFVTILEELGKYPIAVFNQCFGEVQRVLGRVSPLQGVVQSFVWRFGDYCYGGQSPVSPVAV